MMETYGYRIGRPWEPAVEALRERYSYLYSLPQWRFEEVLQKTVALMRSTGELHAPKVSEENADGVER